MEDYVTFDIANKLKEKGFSRICSHYYRTKSKDLFMIFPCEDWSNIGERVNAPTISQVLKWLREEKKIFIHIDVNTSYNFEYFFDINVQGDKTWEIEYVGEADYDTYEAAALAGIEYVLDNLINNN